ncbi:MAG: hypothetical protein JXX29_16075 [Deltaproteobacteria bacterium]|nr:hypothetical protein [Deltaproteobacteria bacterium]MBN2673200.1 hypothetical protein [Deltaproteobacteria bacterium]
MKRMTRIGMICLAALVLVSCKSKTESTKEDTVVADSDQGKTGPGLTEDEAQALLREEKVNAGNEIGKDDVDMELTRLEEEIQADIEGREPNFNAPSAAAAKPLVAKETFSADKASSTLEYEQDMRIMEMIRSYIKTKAQVKDTDAPDSATPEAKSGDSKK